MGFPVAYGGMMTKLLVGLALVMGAAQALWSLLTPSKEEQASSSTTIEDLMGNEEDYGGRYPLINSPFFHMMPEEDEEMVEVEIADMVEMAVVERVNTYTMENSKEEEEEEEKEEGGGCCAVCLCEFVPVVPYRPVGRLPRCSHVFHRECIQQWVHHGHRTCPLCRTALALTPRSTVASIGFEPTNCVRTQLQSLHAR